MDRVTALVVIAHLKLRLERIQRNPHLLEATDMIDIKRPIELAGMKSRLLRAQKLEQDIAFTGKRFDQVLDAIDEKHTALQGHVGSLEVMDYDLGQVIDRMVDRSNGGPNDGGSSSTASTGGETGQVIEGKPVQ